MKPVKRKQDRPQLILENDVITNISCKNTDVLQLSKLLLDFGFMLDGKKYLVDGNKLTSSNWGNNVKSLVAKAKTLPRIGYALNGIASAVWYKYELKKIEYETWLGKEWSGAGRMGTGLHDAPLRKIQAYINAMPENGKFQSELCELKLVHSKLKSLINSLQQQHFSILAILNVYRRNPNEDIGNSAFSSIDIAKGFSNTEESLDDIKTTMFGEEE